MGHTKNNFITKFTLYMVLVSIIFSVVVGYLQGAQEAPDLPLVVALALFLLVRNIGSIKKVASIKFLLYRGKIIQPTQNG